MEIRSGLKAGKKPYPPPPPPPPNPHHYPPPPPPPTYSYTCDHCFGKDDRWGNITNASCNACW